MKVHLVFYLLRPSHLISISWNIGFNINAKGNRFDGMSDSFSEYSLNQVDWQRFAYDRCPTLRTLKIFSLPCCLIMTQREWENFDKCFKQNASHTKKDIVDKKIAKFVKHLQSCETKNCEHSLLHEWIRFQLGLNSWKPLFCKYSHIFRWSLSSQYLRVIMRLSNIEHFSSIIALKLKKESVFIHAVGNGRMHCKLTMSNRKWGKYKFFQLFRLLR